MTGDYKALEKVTTGDKGVTRRYRGCKGLQRVTGGDRG